MHIHNFLQACSFTTFSCANLKSTLRPGDCQVMMTWVNERDNTAFQLGQREGIRGPPIPSINESALALSWLLESVLLIPGLLLPSSKRPPTYTRPLQQERIYLDSCFKGVQTRMAGKAQWCRSNSGKLRASGSRESGNRAALPASSATTPALNLPAKHTNWGQVVKSRFLWGAFHIPTVTASLT